MSLHQPLRFFKTTTSCEPPPVPPPPTPSRATRARAMPDEQGRRSIVGRQLASSWVLIVPLRVFLAAGWLRAAAEKLVDDRWLHGDGVRSFLDLERPAALPFARAPMDSLLHP